ncbi:TRAP transporter small permease subunit [uncultured Tistrella sp.]|uniref:TRAP transporter small permease subunit n=1 Tax=Tistrella mobilis TaxID=171437 RepID=UPI000C09CEB0|nr:TRAP transporter small permease subunit [uncultured Tistrella sp.]MAM74555.1 C4-dicarboxylate ABC transporter permease [Tistrella sp.]
MPAAIRWYVRVVDRLSDYVGIVAMALVFVMIGVLLLDAITRNALDIPLHWCVEVAQFTLLAYFFMGGAMTLKNDDHVRMDLIYQHLSTRGKAILDLITSACLMFYLVVMTIGSVSSLQYAIQTNERRFSMWNPSMIPIKALLVVCLVIMLLQTLSLVFKHIATIRRVDVA